MNKNELLKSIGFSEDLIDKLEEQERKNLDSIKLPVKETLKNSEYVDLQDLRISIDRPLYTTSYSTK